jgi:thioredoxin 1
MNESTPRPRRSFGEWLATKLAGDGSAPSGPVREIDDDRLEVTAHHTVVSFWAPWCGPCRMMRPLIDELAADHQEGGDHHHEHDRRDRHERLEFVRVNVDANPGIAERFRVMSVPTLVAVDASGAELSRLPGLVPKRELDAFIDRLG